MRLYISGGALLLLVLVYLPVVVLALRLLWRRLPPRRPIRIGVSVLAAIAAAAIPLWDVAIASAQMARLCPEAGLKVYRTVEVEGYLTNFGGNLGEITRSGFSYLEEQSTPERILIFTKKGNRVVKTVVDLRETHYVIRSRYQYRHRSIEQVKGALNVAEWKSVVVDRTTGDVLGQAVSYSAFPGWVDRNTIQLVGNLLWTCPSGGGIHVEVLKQTLRPARR